MAKMSEEIRYFSLYDASIIADIPIECLKGFIYQGKITPWIHSKDIERAWIQRDVFSLTNPIKKEDFEAELKTKGKNPEITKESEKWERLYKESKEEFAKQWFEKERQEHEALHQKHMRALRLLNETAVDCSYTVLPKDVDSFSGCSVFAEGFFWECNGYKASLPLSDDDIDGAVSHGGNIVAVLDVNGFFKIGMLDYGEITKSPKPIGRGLFFADDADIEVNLGYLYCRYGKDEADLIYELWDGFLLNGAIMADISVSENSILLTSQDINKVVDLLNTDTMPEKVTNQKDTRKYSDRGNIADTLKVWIAWERLGRPSNVSERELEAETQRVFTKGVSHTTCGKVYSHFSSVIADMQEY